MDRDVDPRVEFAGRLQALREAVDLSLRRLEIESEQTPRRRREEPIRLRRSTAAGMTSRERPVRPEPANFEVFVDTCLRVATENGIELPSELSDRDVWDDSYRRLREDLDRLSRGVSGPAVTTIASVPESASPAAAEPPPEPPVAATPARSRRWVLRAAVPATLAVVAAGWLVPEWVRGVPASGAPASTGEPAPGGAEDRGPGYNGAGRQLSPPLGADNPVWSVAVGHLAGGPLAVVGRADGSVQLFDPVANRSRTSPIPAHSEPVYSVALTSDAAYSVAVDGTVAAWDLRTDPPTSTFLGAPVDGSLNSVAVTETAGRRLLVTAGDDRSVRVWDPATPTSTGAVMGDSLPTEAKSVAIGTARGQTVALVGGADGSLRIYDLTTRTLVAGPLAGHQDVINSISAGSIGTGNVAVSAGEDGDLRLWDLDAPTPSSIRIGQVRNAVKCVTVGDIRGVPVAIAGSDDGDIRVWDLALGKLHGPGLVGPAKGAEGIALGYDGGRPFVVSGHWDGTVWAWRP